MGSNSELPIVVVGGGLGGLCAATGLGNDGHPVLVLEQAAEIEPIGYGIQLGPNVFKVFNALGVSEQVLAASNLPPALVMPDADSGKTLIEVSLTSPTYKERFTHPYVVIHRADLHNVLLEKCQQTPNVELSVNTTVTGFEEAGDHVKVICADGKIIKAAALIGADGLKSRIRQALGHKDELVPNGYVAHRTLIDMKDVPKELAHTEDVVLWAGPGYHVVHYPLRHSSIFNIVSVFRNPATGHGENPEGYAKDLEQVYANAQPVLKKLLSMMNLDRRWVLSDRDPIRNWTRGRVTLLGDAAHPAYQSFAQGAGMAIEDAGCLVKILQQTNYDYEKAFIDYEKARVTRAARLVLESRMLWEFYHAEGLARDVRNQEISERTPDDTYRCLNWVWSGDPLLRSA